MMTFATLLAIQDTVEVTSGRIDAISAGDEIKVKVAGHSNWIIRLEPEIRGSDRPVSPNESVEKSGITTAL